MWNNKINAFTLMEVTIAMVLAAISIGMSFTVYQLMSEAYRQYDGKNKVLSEFVQLDQLLKQDILSADGVFTDAGNLLCEKGEKLVIYSFKEDYITRNQEDIRTDSFFVKNGEVILYFENMSHMENSPVDCLEFNAEFNNVLVSGKYSKVYSARQLMDLENAN